MDIGYIYPGRAFILLSIMSSSRRSRGEERVVGPRHVPVATAPPHEDLETEGPTSRTTSLKKKMREALETEGPISPTTSLKGKVHIRWFSEAITEKDSPSVASMFIFHSVQYDTATQTARDECYCSMFDSVAELIRNHRKLPGVVLRQPMIIFYDEDDERQNAEKLSSKLRWQSIVLPRSAEVDKTIAALVDMFTVRRKQLSLHRDLEHFEQSSTDRVTDILSNEFQLLCDVSPSGYSPHIELVCDDEALRGAVANRLTTVSGARPPNTTGPQDTRINIKIKDRESVYEPGTVFVEYPMDRYNESRMTALAWEVLVEASLLPTYGQRKQALVVADLAERVKLQGTHLEATS
jgi:hypothetical protein